jgi:hypothetical protein
MKKNKCQAYTKKKIPCKNYAMGGSYFCYVHKGLFKDFPPVKITALMCPYCDEPLGRGAKFCKFCKNCLLICPYCDELLRKDAKSCSFCKEDFTPVKPKRDKLNYFSKLISIRNRIAAKVKGMDISSGFFFIVIFFILTLVVFLYIIDIYFQLNSL